MRHMKKALLPILVVVAVGATACPKQTPVTQAYTAASAYDLIQTAAHAYVTDPAADPVIKAKVKDIENQAYNALLGAVDAAKLNDGKQLNFYTNSLNSLLIQLRGVLTR